MRGHGRDLNSLITIITGAYGGVGQACAREFHRAGARLVLTGRDARKLDSMADRFDTDILTVPGDIRDPQTGERVIKAVHSHYGEPAQILINNAGVIHRADTTDTKDADWARVMDVNVNGLFYMSRAFAKQNIHAGAIVNISSTCGSVGAAGLTAYCASKGAVDQITRSLALELAARKIGVNAVAPGAINAPMLFSEHATQRAADTVLERNSKSIPIGSVAEPEDVARAVLYLASEPHITGTILAVDGGYTAQ